MKNMRKILFFILMILSISLFMRAEDTDSVRYVIRGTAPYTMEGKQIQVGYYDNNGIHIISSTKIRKGKFAMEGAIPEPVIARLEVADENLSEGLIALDGSPATVTISYIAFKVVGGKNNERLAAYQKLEKQLFNDELRNNTHELSTQKMKDFIFANADNLVGGYAFGRCSYSMTPEEIDSLFEKTGDDFLTDEQARIAFMKHESEKKRENGKRFVDFTLNEDENGRLRLSDIVKQRQCTLLYFWNPLLPSCISDVTVLKRLYDCYSGRGFEVVGISVNAFSENWEKALEVLKLSWPNLSSPSGDIAQLYGIYDAMSIPCMILIGSDGKIVASEMKMEDLKKVLSEKFGDVPETAGKEDVAMKRAQIPYHITGTLPSVLNGMEVRLYTVNSGSQAIDSTYVRNGKFEFKGKAEEGDRARIYVRGNTFAKQKGFCIENGTIMITYSNNNFHVQGGRMTKALEEYEDSTRILNRPTMSQEDMRRLVEEYNNVNTSDERRRQLEKTLRENESRVAAFIVRFLKRNNDHMIGAQYYRQYCGMLTPDERKKILDTASKEFLDALFSPEASD